ncbi:TPA: hypothetical protein RD427_000408 [Enterococcus faecium]|nr:hypothetical protein [Enterococcus faecium]
MKENCFRCDCCLYYIVAANFFGFIFSSKLLVVLSGDIGVNICHLSVMRIQEFVSIKNYNNNYYN